MLYEKMYVDYKNPDFCQVLEQEGFVLKEA